MNSWRISVSVAPGTRKTLLPLFGGAPGGVRPLHKRFLSPSSHFQRIYRQFHSRWVVLLAKIRKRVLRCSLDLCGLNASLSILIGLPFLVAAGVILIAVCCILLCPISCKTVRTLKNSSRRCRASERLHRQSPYLLLTPTTNCILSISFPSHPCLSSFFLLSRLFFSSLYLSFSRVIRFLVVNR